MRTWPAVAFAVGVGAGVGFARPAFAVSDPSEPAMVTLFKAARALADDIAARPRDVDPKLVFGLRDQIHRRKHLLDFPNLGRPGDHGENPHERMWRAEIRDELDSRQRTTLAREYSKLTEIWAKHERAPFDVDACAPGLHPALGFVAKALGLSGRREPSDDYPSAIVITDATGWPLSRKDLVKAGLQHENARRLRAYHQRAIMSFGYALKQECGPDLR